MVRQTMFGGGYIGKKKIDTQGRLMPHTMVRIQIPGRGSQSGGPNSREGAERSMGARDSRISAQCIWIHNIATGDSHFTERVTWRWEMVERVNSLIGTGRPALSLLANNRTYIAPYPSVLEDDSKRFWRAPWPEKSGSYLRAFYISRRM